MPEKFPHEFKRDVVRVTRGGSKLHLRRAAPVSRRRASTAEMKPGVRLLALGGVIGPVAFVGSWALAGARTVGYSPVDAAISDLAAVHASTRSLMTTGFVVDGLGLIGFGLALREALEGRAWMTAVATGVCTIGVAATPLGGWSGDNIHAAFAGLGYASIAALPLLTATPLARSGRIRWTRVSVLAGTISAASLVASTFGPAHGLWQRLGLTVGDAWIVAIASSLIADRGLPTSRKRTLR